MLDRGKGYSKIAQKIDIGKSTVTDIKKKKQEILEFISRTECGGDRYYGNFKEGGKSYCWECTFHVVSAATKTPYVPISGELKKDNFFH